MIGLTRIVRRGLTSIEAEEGFASSIFKGPCIITIVNEAAASLILFLYLLALRNLVSPLIRITPYTENGQRNACLTSIFWYKSA